MLDYFPGGRSPKRFGSDTRTPQSSDMKCVPSILTVRVRPRDSCEVRIVHMSMQYQVDLVLDHPTDYGLSVPRDAPGVADGWSISICYW
jgi:hypothetical protein